MKKLFLFICLSFFCGLASAAYYVAGNGTSGSSWCDGKNWDPAGSLMTASGDAAMITFTAVPAGSYQFKVTQGNWNSTSYGFAAYSADCSNLYCTGSSDGNVMFSTTQAQDITITFGSNKKICITGTVGNEYPDPSQFGIVGVPAEYEGVMLQAFYWDSHRLTKYSNTKWKTLADNYASEMGSTFDLVWLPPCGNGGGVGYYTKTYSNLDSDWGTRVNLARLIDSLHVHDCKVLADVVINHRQSGSGWARSFTNENFGEFGTFVMTSEHICAGDEAFTNSSSDSRTLPHGAADTGDNDGGCRDLDHTSEFVQQFVEAYENWLIQVVGFDGFRYDMVKGYGGNYVSQYNKASQPFFSVGEYWDGASAIKSWLETAQYNTTAFDFALKYKFNDWKGGSAYGNLKNPGLRALGLSKYAVTFIDNHDTYERDDNRSGEFLGYNVTIANKGREILQANAYLLMMPGIPCVFWPHWYTFKDDIRPMVALRKAAGVHSESVVSDETATTNNYSATIAGHHGSVVLRMGSARDMTVPAGFHLAITGPEMEIYVSDNVDFAPYVMTGIEPIAAGKAEMTKVLIDGKIYILRDGKKYSVLGQLVD